MGADNAETAVAVETGADARGGLIPTRLVRHGQRVALTVVGQPWSAWRGGRLYVHYRVTDGTGKFVVTLRLAAMTGAWTMGGWDPPGQATAAPRAPEQRPTPARPTRLGPELLNALVSVTTAYDHQRRLELPRVLRWEWTAIHLRDVRLAPPSRVGRTTYLHFTATDGARHFELKHNVETREWTLVDISYLPHAHR